MSEAKRAKEEPTASDAAATDAAMEPIEAASDRKMLIQLTSESGEKTGAPMEVPFNVTAEQLQLLTNAIVNPNAEQEGEPTPYAFFVNKEEIVQQLADVVKRQSLETEAVVSVVYQPQAVFRVRPISQCTATIPGHADNIVEAYFSPNGRDLATGSGDKTVRLWDVWTLTPKVTCKGHSHWVQCIAWSPDGKYVASGSRDKQIRIWEGNKGKEVGRPLVGHTNYITWLSWEPLHSAGANVPRLASGSSDGTARVWDVIRGQVLFSVTQHTKGVTCVKWGGSGMIYTGSQDTTVKVWNANDGSLVRSLIGHAHWVNSLALNTDYALRVGAFDERGNAPTDPAEAVKAAQERYTSVSGGEAERVVSASEDNTLYLWAPATGRKPITRLTGHQRGVIYVSYSPDGRFIASCSFDKCAKLWDGRDGTFLGNFRAHVGPVFRCTWAPDSRLLITASEDSTIKLWNVKTQRLVTDLPGHEGSVFAVDWAPNGELVASGGADKMLKM